MKLPARPTEALLLPFTDRAVGDLGYVRPEKTRWFNSVVVEQWNQGSDMFYWRKWQEQLSRDEKEALGYTKWDHIPRALFEALTPAGQRAPLDRFKSTMLRTHKLYYFERQRRDLAAHSVWLFPFAEFTPDHQWPCETARLMDGNIFDADKVPELPFSGCKAEWCRCTFRSLRKK